MSHTKHQMQSKTDTLDEISKSIGLNIHVGKSKMLTSERDTVEGVTLRNTPLEIVESFTYLGSIIDGKGGTEADVRTRIGKARTAFANLSNVWKASKISILPKKKRLFNSNVKSVARVIQVHCTKIAQTHALLVILVQRIFCTRITQIHIYL